ncbi:phage portal protein [Xanthomonas arboricola]|uniref:phage portal protein n=1 Tax=Xanthomonas arboricola TaxID=56448 RepID=UPI001851D283|nr:phage portal protein [Xanthomonas arboricola]MBB3759225.1 lambda family phage portal protein [Xanthomonas arboricola]
MASAAVAADRLKAAVGQDRAVRAALGAAAPQPAASADEVQGTRWRGASRTLRSLQNWLAPVGSATADLERYELTTLRARSRDAMRNAPIARSALMRCRTSIVGTGLVCRPAVDHEALGMSSDNAELISTSLRASWERWAEDPAECDAEAALDFYGLQALALLSAMSSGDVFVLTPQEHRNGGVSELKVQLVEADRVSNPNEAGDTPNCVDGIAIDGATPVGCWIRNTHPGDRVDMRMAAWQFYAYFGQETGRRRVLHIWNDKERPGQVRGAPYLAPVLEPLKQLERYGDAELMAAVISAMFTVFIERDKELADSDGNPLGLFGATEEQPTIALGNGAVVDLAPGEKVSSQALNRPNVNFDPFFTAVVKQIGASLELPLDVLMLQFDRSYSAARAAMLEAWRFFNLRRWYLVQQLCQPIYALHIDEEVAAGRLVLPGYSDPIRRRAWTRALWIGPARGSMDEQKEAGAAKTRIEIGVSNEAMETAAMNGEDWNAVYAQRVREVNRRKADGLYAPAQPVPAAPLAGADDADAAGDGRTGDAA